MSGSGAPPGPLEPPAARGVRDWLRRFGVALVFGVRADPRRFALLVASETVAGIAHLAALFGLKLLTDAAVGQSGSGVIAAAGVIALAGTVHSFGRHGYLISTMEVEERAGLLLDARLMVLTGRAAALEHHERPEYADQLALLRGDGDLRSMANTVVLHLNVLIQLVGGALLLGRLHPLLALVPAFGLGPLLAGRKADAIAERAREANAERERIRKHLFELATTAGPGKELRLFGLADELGARHRAVSSAVLGATNRAALQGCALRLAGSVVFALGYTGSIALVLWQAMRGQATAGDVVLAVALAAQLSGTITWAAQIGTSLVRTLRAAGRYLWLVDDAARRRPTAPQAVEPAAVPGCLDHGITLDGVSFRYPGTAAMVMSDVSLHLPAGAVVAFVGENGAGKTSLVKLLARFYDPERGCISVDGVDLRRFDVEAWRARISAAFQDFSRFELLVRETVGVGDLALLDHEPAVHGALERSGADEFVSALPARLETQLGKDWAGGVDLSGGQWQKLALGRAFMRTDPLLVVFDEPAAALDAQTEHALFERFAAAARSGTSRGTVTVIVSHRFSTVRMADLIVVLDKGRVVEQGDHAELMQREGLYAELYGLQAMAYR